MFSLLWIPATIAASFFQVGRNALQRGIMGTAGPWGATLVRFLFGLPFATLFAVLAWWFTPQLAPHFGRAFWAATSEAAPTSSARSSSAPSQSSPPTRHQ